VTNSAGTGTSAEDAGSAGRPASPEPPASPEDRLARAVRAAEQALIEFEIAVETYRVEVENFSRIHHQRLGPMYTRLDELDALIAEAVAARSGDREDIRRAWHARALVMPMPGVEELFDGMFGPDGVQPAADPDAPRRVRPGKEAQRLYRDLVRRTHPDLAQDEVEKERRSDFIARVNEAYTYGDEEALRALAAEWEAGPAPEPEPAGEAEILHARLEWLAERKELLARLAADLEASAIGQMMKLAPDDPDGLLNEIAENLLVQVSNREARLAELVRESPSGAGSAPARGAAAHRAPGPADSAGDATD
jgi:hypothetical protein